MEEGEVSEFIMGHTFRTNGVLSRPNFSPFSFFLTVLPSHKSFWGIMGRALETANQATLYQYCIYSLERKSVLLVLREYVHGGNNLVGSCHDWLKRALFSLPSILLTV